MRTRADSLGRIGDDRALRAAARRAWAARVRNVASRTVGFDLVVESSRAPSEIASDLAYLVDGTPVYLDGMTSDTPGDGDARDRANLAAATIPRWRCRFRMRSATLALDDALALHLAELVGIHFRWTHLEKLESASAPLEASATIEEHVPF